jgi:hypothetical protein
VNEFHQPTPSIWGKTSNIKAALFTNDRHPFGLAFSHGCFSPWRVILTHLWRQVIDQTQSSSRMLPSVIGVPGWFGLHPATSSNYIYTPAGHTQSISNKIGASITVATAKTIAKTASRRTGKLRQARTGSDNIGRQEGKAALLLEEQAGTG